MHPPLPDPHPTIPDPACHTTFSTGISTIFSTSTWTMRSTTLSMPISMVFSTGTWICLMTECMGCEGKEGGKGVQSSFTLHQSERRVYVHLCKWDPNLVQGWAKN